jgi:hypothetical protein
MYFDLAFFASPWTFYSSSEQRMVWGMINENTRYLYGDAAFQNTYNDLDEDTSVCIKLRTKPLQRQRALSHLPKDMNGHEGIDRPCHKGCSRRIPVTRQVGNLEHKGNA